MPSASAASVPVGERIATLDVLRGLALLGILIMNMPGFSTSFFAEADGSHLWPGAVDQFAEQVRDMLFSGKFNSMFSLLFGIGFTIQFARMERREPAGASALYLRRLAVLAVIGIVHATLFWQGDVLHIYAMLGLLLVFPLRRARARTIVLLIVRLAQDPAWARRLAPLAVTGRMPLTNYLMQTAICTTLFYAWGFGLWGKVGPAWGLALAFAIFFAIQVPWSVGWLKRYERGPIEALWARVTYGTTPARAAAAAD